MKYEEALKYITTTKKFGEKHGLDGINRLCRQLKNPEKNLKFVHVAGTNGKGSTSSYIATVLFKAGYKTGLFTSPFIYEFNERIKINGENISDDDLAQIMTEVKAAIDELVDGGNPHPTEFEVITAAAFLYFYRKKCDIVVLEVGLGGRFDATNVIEAPLVSAICSVGYDHMQFLGESLAEIAFEKCGIIKEGRPVVCYPCQDDETMDVIKKISEKRNARLIECDKEKIIIKKIDLDGAVFDACGICDVETKLCGKHQVYNAAVAMAVLKELARQGFKVVDEMIKEGIKQTVWPARMEKMCEKPCLIFDGAHNIDGMKAFVRNVRMLAENKKIIVVLGMVSDKEYDKCISELDGTVDALITTTLENPRRETAEKLMEKAKHICCEKHITKNVGEALDKAFSLWEEDSIIFAVGSLYMANEIKMKIEKNRDIIK